MSDQVTPVYPLSLRLDGRLAVVIGGGAVAVRQVAGLLAAGADVLVVAPGLTPSLADLVSRGLIRTRQGRYRAADLRDAWLVLACTDQPAVNAAVAADAERVRLWCVRTDDARASAGVPAVGRADGVTVAVNADRNPRRAAALRDDWLRMVRDSPPQPQPEQPGRAQANRGRVSIVGSGPGDPDLITIAGAERLRRADVVVTDRLVARELLANLPDGTVVIDAGKVPSGPAMRQADINALLVEHAQAGRAVVRLKGGDPFVFGRGREEADACHAAGVPVDVVPGVTSAVSVPAAAGIPVTHRGLSQGFTVVTGHGSRSGPRTAIDWEALARSGTTLVLLMAVESIAAIAGTLMKAGLAAETPAACVSDGWGDRQRVVTATLRGLPGAMRAGGAANPAVIVIGDTARYATPGEDGALPPGPESPPIRSVSRPSCFGESVHDLTVDAFLAQLADRTPAPGGGASAALHAAQAAALVAMVARYSTGEKYAGHASAIARICEKADALRAAALDLAAEDADAFRAVAAAYQMPRGDTGEKAARSAAIAAATVDAAQPPTRVIAVSDEIVGLAEELSPIGNRNVISDVAAAAAAARAAVATAQVNVEVNAVGVTHGPTRDSLLNTASEADDIARRAGKVIGAVRAIITG